MEQQFNRRVAHLEARQIVMKHNSYPAIMELYRLYRGLEHDYLNVLERAIWAESALDKVRALIGKGDEPSGKHEREAAGGDLRDRENGGPG